MDDPSELLPDASAPDLDDRERAILASLPAEGAGRVAFQGLRRRLDLHQQALTRTLRRLQRYDLVEGDDDGYYRLGGERNPPRHRGCCGARPGQAPVALGVLPSHLDAERVRDHLGGRWFQGLRWYGWRRGPGGLELQWLTEPRNDLVTLHLDAHRYAVHAEVEEPPGAGAGAAAASTAPLLAALAELFPGGDGASAS